MDVNIFQMTHYYTVKHVKNGLVAAIVTSSHLILMTENMILLLGSKLNVDTVKKSKIIVINNALNARLNFIKVFA